MISLRSSWDRLNNNAPAICKARHVNASGKGKYPQPFHPRENVEPPTTVAVWFFLRHEILLEFKRRYSCPITNSKNFKLVHDVVALILSTMSWHLSVRYYPEHLTSDSAQTTLSGQKHLFVFGIIDSMSDDGVISAIPYVIATLLPGLGKASIKGMRWSNRMEVFVDSIDSFALVKNEPQPKLDDLLLLKDIPEDKVKHAFAEIIKEPNVPKDWGGEKSDLFSSVVLDGERISTAFAFKGPAKFKPMTLAECGKNGNQINRLFSEPADLLVLQHCHDITSDVRDAMRAYATRIGNPRLFLIVNGFDTLRILRAYGKCGFTPTPPVANGINQN